MHTKHFSLASPSLKSECGVRKDNTQLMTDYSHILFNKSPLQLRLLGARGGKAFGRNQRLRRALLPTPPPATVSLPAVLLRTTAEDIAVLDARFPWLRGAERRVTRRPAHAASDNRRAA
jgi:hypothetical protein